MAVLAILMDEQGRGWKLNPCGHSAHLHTIYQLIDPDGKRIAVITEADQEAAEWMAQKFMSGEYKPNYPLGGYMSIWVDGLNESIGVNQSVHENTLILPNGQITHYARSQFAVQALNEFRVYLHNLNKHRPIINSLNVNNIAAGVDNTFRIWGIGVSLEMGENKD